MIPALVHPTNIPKSILFTNVGIYGQVHTYESFNPTIAMGHDSLAYKVNIGLFNSNISAGPDSNSNTMVFRFGYKTLNEGSNTGSVTITDSADTQDTYSFNVNVFSPANAPKKPISASFVNAADQTVIYAPWDFTSLFGGTGGSLVNRKVVITDNSNSLLVGVKVQVEAYDQLVKILLGGTIYSTVNIASGASLGTATLNLAGVSGKMEFQIKSEANGFLSPPLPDSGWSYIWVKGDTAPPTTFNFSPAITQYNGETGADAKPFPSTFSGWAKDTADGSILSFLEKDICTAYLKNKAGATMAGVATRSYNEVLMSYGYQYDLSASVTTEGIYFFTLDLKDATRTISNNLISSFAYILDKTGPNAFSPFPSDGSTLNSLGTMSCRMSDPALGDGTSGTGILIDNARSLIVPYRLLSKNQPVNATTYSGAILGGDAAATNHCN